MQRIEHWSDLRVFAAVVRAESLVAAASALQMNHSTVFRRVKRLEEQLESRLLTRRGRRYVPTEVGLDVFEIAGVVGESINALERRVIGADAELSGEVVFTTVAEMMRLVRPHLARFREAFPGIRLHVRLATRRVDLANREADVALRAGRRPDEPNLTGRKVGLLPFAAFASREYLATQRPPRDGEDLAHLDWIAFHSGRHPLPSQRWVDARVHPERIAVRSDSIQGLLEGALAGLGVALLPRPIAQREPSLVELFDVDVSGDLWMLWHQDLHRTARVRALSSFLGGALHAELAPGGGPGVEE